MPCQIDIRAKKEESYPAIYLFRIENEHGDLKLARYAELKKYEQFILSHTEKKIWLFRIPDAKQDIFIQIVNTKDKDNFQIKEEFRLAGSRFGSSVRQFKYKGLNLFFSEEAEHCLSWAEGFVLGEYSFIKYKKNADPSGIEKILIINRKVENIQINRLNTILQAVYLARNMVNEPGSVLTSVELAGRIKTLGKQSGFEVDVLNKNQITALKMGGLLAVNRGSKIPPTFSILKWQPEYAVNQKPVILIGKGVVFDSGGLSLKPTLNSMDEMKCDMAGAAAVIAVINAIAELKLPLKVIGLIPATDNRPGEDAYLPGDIITIMNGTSVEVLNCDAEGRLLLADALCFAKKYEPELVIDLATLTGSASMAVGRYASVVFSKAGEKITGKMFEAAGNSYERLVEFPLWDEYKESLNSDVADLKNIGGKEAGAITAAKFLEHFVSFPWIHLDIAGTAFASSANGYIPKGGTGVTVRLLFDFITQLMNDYGK